MVWRGVVQCGVVRCGVMWCGVVWCGLVWRGVAWCGVVWRGVAWCGVMWGDVANDKCMGNLVDGSHKSLDALWRKNFFPELCPVQLPLRALSVDEFQHS